MATRFIQAANKKTGTKSMLHDTDAPIGLFVELAKKNTHTGETMTDWDFALLDYNGRVIQQNYNWRKLQVTITLGDLFR